MRMSKVEIPSFKVIFDACFNGYNRLDQISRCWQYWPIRVSAKMWYRPIPTEDRAVFLKFLILKEIEQKSRTNNDCILCFIFAEQGDLSMATLSSSGMSWLSTIQHLHGNSAAVLSQPKDCYFLQESELEKKSQEKGRHFGGRELYGAF